MDEEKARRVLDLLLTGYSYWVLASETTMPTDRIRLSIGKMVSWFNRAAKMVGMEVPREIVFLIESYTACIDNPDMDEDECTLRAERMIQNFMFEVLKRVFGYS